MNIKGSIDDRPVTIRFEVEALEDFVARNTGRFELLQTKHGRRLRMLPKREMTLDGNNQPEPINGRLTHCMIYPAVERSKDAVGDPVPAAVRGAASVQASGHAHGSDWTYAAVAGHPHGFSKEVGRRRALAAAIRHLSQPTRAALWSAYFTVRPKGLPGRR